VAVRGKKQIWPVEKKIKRGKVGKLQVRFVKEVVIDVL